MDNNLFETQYDITKKSKIRKFYESNRIFIFSFILILIISIGSVTFFIENKKNKKILLSESYVQSKIYLEEGKKNEALNILKEVIFANDSTYSTLCLFLILDQNLITNNNEISSLFDHLLKNNKFETEIENLIIFKKSLFYADFVSETELLETAKPLLTGNSLWKPHTLLLLGDYFTSKNEKTKAKEFYLQILSIKNLQKDFYDQATSKLVLISND